MQFFGSTVERFQSAKNGQSKKKNPNMVGPGTYEMPVQQMISGTVVANSLRNGKTVGFVSASDRFN